MPKLKKSARAEFLAVMTENLRICCKIFGVEKLSVVMGISVKSVYNRLKKPNTFTVDELFILSQYMGISPEDLVRPLKFVSGGKGGENP